MLRITRSSMRVIPFAAERRGGVGTPLLFSWGTKGELQHYSRPMAAFFILTTMSILL